MTSRLALVVLLFACKSSDDSEPALFPDDYAATYQEVRNCRNSIEHGGIRVRVLASPDAVMPYKTRAQPFPTGALVVKEEYDGGDVDCGGPIVQFTVMQKLDVGSAPDTLDWEWQEVDRDLHAKQDTLVERCTQCHTDCGKPPEGYDATCTVP